jgi:hypothetical protein
MSQPQTGPHQSVSIKLKPVNLPAPAQRWAAQLAGKTAKDISPVLGEFCNEYVKTAYPLLAKSICEAVIEGMGAGTFQAIYNAGYAAGLEQGRLAADRAGNNAAHAEALIRSIADAIAARPLITESAAKALGEAIRQPPITVHVPETRPRPMIVEDLPGGRVRISEEPTTPRASP